jgi:hypothetical protein
VRSTAAGLDDSAIQRMNWLVEGVVGAVPGS